MPKLGRVFLALILGLSVAATAAAEKVYLVTAHAGIREFDLSELQGRPKSLPDKVVQSKAVTFNITYRDGSGSVGFGTGAPESAERRARLEEALAYVADTIDVSGEIDVEVDVSDTSGTGFLAAAGTFFTADPGFQGGTSFTRLTTGVKPIPEVAEIYIIVNFGYNWHAGTGPPTGGAFDLSSVLIHEVTHGMGVISLIGPSGASRIASGVYTEFDAFMRRGNDDDPLVDGQPPEFLNSPAILTNNEVTWAGPNAVDAFGQRPPIYSPRPFSPGSSMSHWALGTGAIMEPSIAPGIQKREFQLFEVAAFEDFWNPPTRVSEGRFFLRATPTETLEGDPAVALTWLNPAADEYDRVVLVRRLDRFAQSTEEGERIFTGRQQRFLDTNVQAGLKYYYTLFVETALGGSQVSFASAELSGRAPTALSEGFGPDPVTGALKPLDLAFSQITFTPVGAPVGAPGSSAATGTYADYATTVRTDVQRLPVPREDVDGKAISLSLMEDAAFRVPLGSVRFPYFGRQYSTVYVAANGYIAFSDYSAVPQLNFPSVESHFAVPRISPLFADLAPSIGGSIWLRFLPDRMVVTYENMPEFRVESGIAPPGGNTLQAELYYSGQIRFTYLGLAARRAFVGLSDGRGIPLDPATVFEGVKPVDFFVDFSELAATSDRLSILPIAPTRVDAGDTVSFPVRTSATGGVPVLYAEWTRNGAVPFADEGDGSGQFEWRTDIGESGTTTVRFFALLEDALAYQDVRIVVGPALLLPEAVELRLSTNTPFEDASRSRPVADDRPLQAQYTYTHPLLSSNAGQFREGTSVIYWYRNGLLMPGFTNQRSVPAEATRPMDRWQFQVIPISVGFISGRQATSPIVTIMGYPTVSSVSPNVGLVTGGQTVRIRGTRLNGATSVTIGGVEVAGMRTISPEEIEVVTPVRGAGLFDVVVTTVNGSGRMARAFQYVNSLSEVINPDVNGDGKVDALDVQVVLNVLLAQGDAKSAALADVNGDGRVNAADLQLVVGAALRR